MSTSKFRLHGLADPRLSVHATSPLPAWLWSSDGARVLWANAAGARVLGAANIAALAGKTIGPADVHRRQVAQLAGRLPASGAARLERLRGFGALPGMLVTCSCARLDFPNGASGILIASLEGPRQKQMIGLVAPAPEQTPFSNEPTTGFTLADEFAAPPSAASEPAPPAAHLAPMSPPDETAARARRHPLRFAWHMDADGRFWLGSDEFTWLIGAQTTAGFGRPWQEIAEAFGLDPAGRIVEAIATREPWRGITVYWPVDGGGRLPVELSGSPISDSMQAFIVSRCGHLSRPR
jgi:hypothetical protein